jgi:hypothetical protein
VLTQPADCRRGIPPVPSSTSEPRSPARPWACQRRGAVSRTVPRRRYRLPGVQAISPAPRRPWTRGRRTVIVRMTAGGEKLATVRIDNDPVALAVQRTRNLAGWWPPAPADAGTRAAISPPSRSPAAWRRPLPREGVMLNRDDLVGDLAASIRLGYEAEADDPSIAFELPDPREVDWLASWLIGEGWTRPSGWLHEHVRPTDPVAEARAASLFGWTRMIFGGWAATAHALTTPEEERQQCGRIRFRASAVLHKSGWRMRADTARLGSSHARAGVE